MLRSTLLAALALAALSPARAAAQPGLPGSFQIVDAQADGGALVYTTTEAVPVTKVVKVTVKQNGVDVAVERQVTVFEYVQIKRKTELKAIKATDGTGKAIAADKLAELLKAETPVVILSGAITDKQRGLFKDKTVFIELPAPAAPPK